MDEYLIKKRLEVLEAIKPICDAFNIKDYDYEIKDNHEILRIYNTKIGCDSNSIYAIKKELVGYLFICYYKESCLPFKAQVFNRIKCYWIK